MNLNVDPAEINKFSQMAREWWNPNGPMKPLHALNPLRLQYVKKHAELREKHVLDLGCGAGILTEPLAEAGALKTGIEMSDDPIQAEKNMLNYQNYQST